MITFTKLFAETDLVRLFEPGSAKWVELYINPHGDRSARFRSTKEDATPIERIEATTSLLDQHNIDRYDFVAYPSETVGTSV